MENLFSNEERFDMLTCYIKANRNADTASQNYHIEFPERRQPHKTYFRRLVLNLLNHGSFVQRRSSYNKENNERNAVVAQFVENNPYGSVREISRQTNIPKVSVHRVLQNNKLHPYKPTVVQGLNDNDFPRRMNFCRWYVDQCHQDPEFPSRVIWTDESLFSNCGVYNKHNYHYWATQNPHLVRARRLQRRFKVNVWCGILGKHCSIHLTVFS